jgi:hypothetical protein
MGVDDGFLPPPLAVPPPAVCRRCATPLAESASYCHACGAPCDPAVPRGASRGAIALWLLVAFALGAALPIALGARTRRPDSARRLAFRADMRRALDAYHADHGRWPATFGDLTAPSPGGEPYLREAPSDPVGGIRHGIRQDTGGVVWELRPGATGEESDAAAAAGQAESPAGAPKSFGGGPPGDAM